MLSHRPTPSHSSPPCCRRAHRGQARGYDESGRGRGKQRWKRGGALPAKPACTRSFLAAPGAAPDGQRPPAGRVSTPRPAGAAPAGTPPAGARCCCSAGPTTGAKQPGGRAQGLAASRCHAHLRSGTAQRLARLLHARQCSASSANGMGGDCACCDKPHHRRSRTRRRRSHQRWQRQPGRRAREAALPWARPTCSTAPQASATYCPCCAASETWAPTGGLQQDTGAPPAGRNRRAPCVTAAGRRVLLRGPAGGAPGGPSDRLPSAQPAAHFLAWRQPQGRAGAAQL